jgi:hypothetical protein
MVVALPKGSGVQRRRQAAHSRIEGVGVPSSQVARVRAGAADGPLATVVYVPELAAVCYGNRYTPFAAAFSQFPG